MGFSIQHLLVLLVIVVLIFGTKKLRNLGQDLGGAIKGFKDGMKQGDDAAAQAAPAATTPPPEQVAAKATESNGRTIDATATHEAMK